MTRCKPADVVQNYLLAKDGNRPHLLREAFAPDATLEVLVKTDSISFAPVSHGREAIEELLVRRFAQTYENIYTFCLEAPPAAQHQRFACRWLVAMTEKENRSVRARCGSYHWEFAPHSGLAQRLMITIDTMESFDPIHQPAVLNWVSKLPYPWCSTQRATKDAPSVEILKSLQKRLLGKANQSNF